MSQVPIPRAIVGDSELIEAWKKAYRFLAKNKCVEYLQKDAEIRQRDDILLLAGGSVFRYYVRPEPSVLQYTGHYLPGDIINRPVLLRKSFKLVVRDGCTLIRIGKSAFRELLTEHEKVARIGLLCMQYETLESARIIYRNARLHDKDRVAEALVDLSQFPSMYQEDGKYVIQAQKKEMRMMADVKRRNSARVFMVLEQEGILIPKPGNGLFLFDKEKAENLLSKAEPMKDN
ncbi:hypothetical protein NX722_16650 [Endozoicomonas gorgoniicola]|uniref:Cyclic nucleotide-binding domain-containing protein n=1 Tax=Endozoicomonas gorgoniicola TaxID=1234144 RepID=A0ABT3MYZ5_9GAMM|nr:hypothetical protein [Endozoicomonas gorgoniicola]MCW7554219.1 hypothetical protein [Endozoicomonas gorgoniicola]